MDPYTEIDYFLVGHITKDLAPGDRVPAGWVPGGTVTYAGRTAQALGCRVAVLTSASADVDTAAILPDVAVRCLPAEESTTFDLVYTPAGRQQTLHGLARTLTTADVPEPWSRAPIVHLGPVVHEVDPDMIDLFSNSLVGLTPQGWFRTWDERGRVGRRDWPAAERVMGLAAAVILSEEDLPEPGTLDQIRRWARLTVLTERHNGCTVFFLDESRSFPAPQVEEVNPTGAGDVFAAAFLTRLQQTRGNPWAAAEFANQVASTSITADRLEDKIQLIKELTEGAFEH